MYIGWALRCTKLEIIVEDTVKTFKTDILKEIGIPLDTNNYLDNIIKPIVPLSSEYLPFAKSISVTEYIMILNYILLHLENFC